MKNKEQCEEQMKLMIHTLAECDPYTHAENVTQGWINALKWVLEHEN